jgi:hypothetical protein
MFDVLSGRGHPGMVGLPGAEKRHEKGHRPSTDACLRALKSRVSKATQPTTSAMASSNPIRQPLAQPHRISKGWRPATAGDQRLGQWNCQYFDGNCGYQYPNMRQRSLRARRYDVRAGI